ncbi:MAG: 16S rRNA processing protein RimM [Ferruginibacter sp.]|nr:16S rRNA processing protein RimM [Ferruginibacter sp.]
MSAYTRIGKIVAAHGLKGEVILVHHLGKKTSLQDVRALFIKDTQQQLIPWFIEKATARNEEECLVKLEDIHTREGAKKVFPKEVWLTETDFQKLVAANAPIALLGYEVIHEKTPLGIISEVIEQPHQVLCALTYKDKEVLIPLHQGTLIKIDRKQKKVFVQLPDGLLEVYTG